MLRTKENEAYAAEVLRRYDEFRAWAIDHWPHRDDPIASADFTAGRQELTILLDARLDGQPSPPAHQEAAAENVADPDADQYRQVTAAPWP